MNYNNLAAPHPPAAMFTDNNTNFYNYNHAGVGVNINDNTDNTWNTGTANVADNTWTYEQDQAWLTASAEQGN